MSEIRDMKYWLFPVKKMCIWQFHIPIVLRLCSKLLQLGTKRRTAIVTRATVYSITSTVNSQRTIQCAPLRLVLMQLLICILPSRINRSASILRDFISY
jgi:hypothetical protein